MSNPLLTPGTEPNASPPCGQPKRKSPEPSPPKRHGPRTVVRTRGLTEVFTRQSIVQYGNLKKAWCVTIRDNLRDLTTDTFFFTDNENQATRLAWEIYTELKHKGVTVSRCNTFTAIGDERREEDGEGYEPVRPSKYFPDEPDQAFGALIMKPAASRKSF